MHNGKWNPGKVHPSHNVCYIPFGDKEIGCRDYEVLVNPSESASYFCFFILTLVVGNVWFVHAALQKMSHTTNHKFPANAMPVPCEVSCDTTLLSLLQITLCIWSGSTPGTATCPPMQLREDRTLRASPTTSADTATGATPWSARSTPARASCTCPTLAALSPRGSTLFLSASRAAT